MAFRFFQVPARGDEDVERELNSFLGSHRILSATREFANVGGEPSWCFCVDYLENASVGKGKSGGRREKIDYKEVLEPEEFSLFAKLRDLRKELAQSEAVPVYAIFTNEQLAQIAKNRTPSKSGLRSVDGLGDSRIEKYGDLVLDLVAKHWGKS